jgi:hypothetical protein
MEVRRVVTGQTLAGKSVFVSDERVAPVTAALLPGSEFHHIWGGDATVALPSAGVEPPNALYFPPAGGFRFIFFTVAPNTAAVEADLDMVAAVVELGQKLPGLAEAMEMDSPGMHTTDTVDCIVVLSGEVWLELDDGAEVHLRPGDTVVQNGTRHAWRNKSDQPCVLAGALVGAARQE